VPALGPAAVEPGIAKSAAVARTATTASPIGPRLETGVSENGMPRRWPGHADESPARRSHARPAWVPNDVRVHRSTGAGVRQRARGRPALGAPWAPRLPSRRRSAALDRALPDRAWDQHHSKVDAAATSGHARSVSTASQVARRILACVTDDDRRSTWASGAALPAWSARPSARRHRFGSAPSPGRPGGGVPPAS